MANVSPSVQKWINEIADTVFVHHSDWPRRARLVSALIDFTSEILGAAAGVGQSPTLVCEPGETIPESILDAATDAGLGAMIPGPHNVDPCCIRNESDAPVPGTCYLYASQMRFLARTIIEAAYAAEDRETICEACATGTACHSEPCPGVVEVPSACTNGLHL